jgi:hypothetical protein
VISDSPLKSASCNLADYLFKLYAELKVWHHVKKFNDSDPSFREYVGILQGAFDQNPVAFKPAHAFAICEEINSGYLQ